MARGNYFSMNEARRPSSKRSFDNLGSSSELFGGIAIKYGFKKSGKELRDDSGLGSICLKASRGEWIAVIDKSNSKNMDCYDIEDFALKLRNAQEALSELRSSRVTTAKIHDRY